MIIMIYDTNKKTISDTFAIIRKYGGKVYNFNSKKALTPGMKDFVDFVIIYRSSIYFIEVKIGEDKFSEGQE